MSLLLVTLRMLRRAPYVSSVLNHSVPIEMSRCLATKTTYGDPLEHATGLEKREMLAQIAGNCDPYGIAGCKIGTGTKEDPIQVKSAFDSRIVGCVCNEEASLIGWMWVHADEPKRCECGRWFALVQVDPL